MSDIQNPEGIPFVPIFIAHFPEVLVTIKMVLRDLAAISIISDRIREIITFWKVITN
jgi:hypothetical protein